MISTFIAIQRNMLTETWVKDTLYGNLTGNAPSTFKLDNNFDPINRVFTHTAIYTTDGFNLRPS